MPDANLADGLAISGLVTIQIHDCLTGTVTVKKVRNMITHAGQIVFGNRLIGKPEQPFTHIGIGTGATPPTQDDTELENEVHRGAVTRTRSLEGQAEIEYYLQRAAANNVPAPLRELGLFAGDTLCARTLLPEGINKSQRYAIVFTWAIRLKWAPIEVWEGI